MLLERTISQLDIGDVSPDRAIKLGHLGYIQWLGGLTADANYRACAMHALTRAAPFMEASPAVGVFCDLLIASTAMPPAPLHLSHHTGHRRGGAKARRGTV